MSLRFLKPFSGNYISGSTLECWNWIGRKNRKGYGLAGTNKLTGSRRAHRIMWVLENGPIPDGMCVCHTCDNPSCVNPDHLFLGTPAQNSMDMVLKKRSLKGERNPNSKLTSGQVMEIRNSTEIHSRLSKRFGVSPGLISLIQTRKIWNE